MTRRILDSESVPTDAQLRAAKQSGIDGWFGYLGGPALAGGQTTADAWIAGMARVRAAELATAGFWVGLGSPDDAVQAARSAGLLSGTVVEQDVEDPYTLANITDAYCDAFSNGLRAAGYRPVLYGLPGTCQRYGVHYDGVHFAGGPYYRTGKNPPPSDPRDGGYALPFANQGWQWYGTHDFNGIGVDESVVDDWFIGDVMDWNTVVKSWYLLAYRRNPQQSEVDYWVSKLRAGENGEQVLDEFFSGAEGQHFLHPPVVSVYSAP